MYMATPTVKMPVISAATDRRLFFSRSELMQRGWSHTAMRLFLRESDDTNPRPAYLITRVLAAEASPVWRAWRWAGPRRRLQIECECG
jgi:hypothetical protein